MKKVLLVLVILLSVVSFGFSQISAELNVKTIQEEAKTTEGLPYLMTIQYLPGTGEAFFIFSMKTALFDQDEAMLSIRNRAEQFIKETLVENELDDDSVRADQKYYSYVYRGADTLKHDAAKDVSHYTSRILFSDVR